MAGAYTWLTWANAKAALAGRLNDPAKVRWVDAELAIHLTEALRTWNALTESYPAEFQFTPTVTSGTAWTNLATLTGNPRLRTVTDAELYTSMQYALLEPPTGGGTWTGTNQFNLPLLQDALYRRCQELIQAFNCNNNLIPLPSTPGVTRVLLPDNVLEPQRVRFIPDPATGEPINTLTREDEFAFDAFETLHNQTFGTPQSWSTIDEPILAIDTDVMPNVAGSFDAIVLQAGQPFAPPAATLLGIPDDWTHIARWGALADLLGGESEATDRQRAAYCLQRFTQGLKLVKDSNWLMNANVGMVPAEIVSLKDQDSFNPEWEASGTDWPTLVVAGVDFFSPDPISSPSVGLTLVGNMPIPATDANFVQVNRDVFDVILGYAQHLACFKEGGQTFTSTKPLLDDFMRAAAQANKRIAELGLFFEEIHDQGRKQEKQEPRG